MSGKTSESSSRLAASVGLAACVLALLAVGATLLWMLSLAGDSSGELRGTRVPVSAPVDAPIDAPAVRRPPARPVVNATPTPRRAPVEDFSRPPAAPASPRPAEAGDLDV